MLSVKDKVQFKDRELWSSDFRSHIKRIHLAKLGLGLVQKLGHIGQ